MQIFSDWPSSTQEDKTGHKATSAPDYRHDSANSPQRHLVIEREIAAQY